MLFGNLRAAGKMTAACLLIQKQLEVESACGAFKGDTKTTADKLVSAIWSEVPALRNVEELPRAATLAAAAMANGVRYFDGTGNQQLADILFRCLSTFLQYVFPKLVMQPEYLRGVDRELLDLAYVPFDNLKAPKVFPDIGRDLEGA